MIAMFRADIAKMAPEYFDKSSGKGTLNWVRYSNFRSQKTGPSYSYTPWLAVMQ